MGSGGGYRRQREEAMPGAGCGQVDVRVRWARGGRKEGQGSAGVEGRGGHCNGQATVCPEEGGRGQSNGRPHGHMPAFHCGERPISGLVSPCQMTADSAIWDAGPT